MYTEVQAGKTIRFSHDPTDINFKGKSLWNEWEYKKINMGIKNYSQKEIFGMQPTNYEFLDKIADVFTKVNVSKLASVLSKENCELISVQERDESLESYYMNLVGGKKNV